MPHCPTKLGVTTLKGETGLREVGELPVLTANSQKTEKSEPELFTVYLKKDRTHKL